MTDRDSSRGVLPLLHYLEIARGVIVPYRFGGVEIWEIMTVGQRGTPHRRQNQFQMAFTGNAPGKLNIGLHFDEAVLVWSTVHSHK
jgi:hypothetical protein